MTSSLEEILTKVLKRVNPNANERKKIQMLAQKLTKKVEKAAKEKGLNLDVRIEGSVAKNTWLRDCPEIDVFMQVPITSSRDSFGSMYLEIAKKATKGYKQIERFAEHPYLEAVIDNVWVNIVPSYKVKCGKWASATDRTPFHTDYIKQHLDEKLEEEIRLLKRFMKGVGVYGAEIKVGGFSGYLCELLILKYGSFVKLLRSVSKWDERTIIDYERHYEEIGEIKEIFVDPLVIVDPVDKERNAAAAVRKQRLNEFVAASREFLKRPDINFFYPQETKALGVTQLANKISSRGSIILFLKFNGKAVPDVLWGQLYKSQRKLRKIIIKYDFRIFRDTVWSNEKDLNIFIFEIENRYLPNLKHHLGPPLENEVDCEKFLLKYNGTGATLSGPRIESGRWVVDVKRDYADIVELLNEKLKDGGKRIGIAKLVSKAITESLEILVNNEVLKLFSTSSDFAKFLTEYLEGKPKWLH